MSNVSKLALRRVETYEKSAFVVVRRSASSLFRSGMLQLAMNEQIAGWGKDSYWCKTDLTEVRCKIEV